LPLAPELDLDDHPCVSFAPVDDHALWLAIPPNRRWRTSWAEWGHAPGLPAPADDPRWTELCRALDLHPDAGSPDITAGARSNRAISPTVPLG
jgi:hypothetical protein